MNQTSHTPPKVKGTVVDISNALASNIMKKDSKIEVFGWSERELENMMRGEIIAALGKDKDALKAFEVRLFKPENAEQALALRRAGKPLFRVIGALGLNDSGHGWRAFDFNIESGLSTKLDMEIATSLAHQCKACVAEMKREPNNKRRVIVGRG